MIGAAAVATGADDRLVQFVRHAVARGRRQFLASAKEKRVTIRLAGRAMTVAESVPSLADSVRECLDSDGAHVKDTSDISVFIDYSGYHLAEIDFGIIGPADTMLSIDRRLRDVGLRASFGEGLQVCDILDPAVGFGVRLQAGVDATPLWEPTAPLAYFCKWIAEMQGLTMVHAASLVQHDTGVLLVGHGGAGKSGTVVGGLLTGFQSAGDDYVLISGSGPAQAHAVYRTVKQDNAGLERLGLPEAAVLNWQKKAVFRPESLGTSRIIATVPLHAILMPTIGAEKTVFRRIDPAEVFKTLSISTLKQIGGGGEQVFRACAALVRDLPCFSVALSADKDEIAAELATFLRALRC